MTPWHFSLDDILRTNPIAKIGAKRQTCGVDRRENKGIRESMPTLTTRSQLGGSSTECDCTKNNGKWRFRPTHPMTISFSRQLLKMG
ncbi:hypothetical protein PspLS_01723 [Pyricularia sp. CBS 133598]|nr:hypothetical protein PspLS_01723 [Pyricularia sp. CBS 133598]